MTEVTTNTAVSIEATTDSSVTTPDSVKGTVDLKDFISGLSDPELKSSKSLEKFVGKSADDVAKSYLNLEKLASQKSPSAPEKYVLAEDAEKLVNDKIIETAKKSNITQEQLKALTDTLVEVNRLKSSEIEKMATEEMDKRVKALQDEFGTSLEKRQDAIKKVFSQYGSEGLIKKIQESGLAHDIEFVKFADKIAQDALQAKLVGEDYAAQKALTPAEAKAEVNKIYSDGKLRDAYFNKFSPDHKEVVQKVQSLYEIIG